MRCPYCKAKDSAVIDSRASEDGFSIRRRRQCESCGKRFTTFERAELNLPTVVKRDGGRCEFDREKLKGSMRLALRKRPVTMEAIEASIDAIELALMTMGEKEVPSAKIGELVLKELKKLDSVAYIRFASVYFNVDKPEGFRNLMRDLEATQHNKGRTLKTLRLIRPMNSGCGRRLKPRKTPNSLRLRTRRWAV